LIFKGGSQGSCSICPDGSYSSASGSVSCIQGNTASNSGSGIVPIFDFKAPYQLSEIIDQVRIKMVQAIAKMLGVNKSSVVLTFSSVDLRRRALLQKTGVLVRVGLTDLQSFASIFVSKITSDSINAAMKAEGLDAVQLINVFIPGNDSLRLILSEFCCHIGRNHTGQLVHTNMMIPSKHSKKIQNTFL
jgi:hypothetical protein